MFEAIQYVNVPEDDAAAEPFAVEYLQSISLGSIPPFCLPLKIVAPLLLIQNLSPWKGLCNGTRMRALGIWRTSLQVAILDGGFDCMIHLLPGIKLTTSDENLPYILKHTQFPVRLCFAMNVNKSQGQSLTHIGVDLPTTPFSQGQLYVPLLESHYWTD